MMMMQMMMVGGMKKGRSGRKLRVVCAAAVVMLMMMMVARGTAAQEDEQQQQEGGGGFEFGAPVEKEETMLVADVCWQEPAVSAEDLLEQQELLEEQLQANFFLFLPCALGGATNEACCENIENQLGPYLDAPLHNCLCLPGAWNTLVDGTTGVGQYNVTDIFYGCRARDDVVFKTKFLDSCDDSVIIPEGYDPEAIAEFLEDFQLPPEEERGELTDAFNQIIEAFRPPTPPAPN